MKVLKLHWASEASRGLVETHGWAPTQISTSACLGHVPQFAFLTSPQKAVLLPVQGTPFEHALLAFPGPG